MRIRYWMMRPSFASPNYRGRGGFIYIIRNDNGFRKIGISCNPTRRMAELRTGTAGNLTFEYIGALNCDGYAIEISSHDILNKYHVNGDWFSCPLEIAIAAISVACARLGQPIASVDPARVDEIVAAVSWDRPQSIKNILMRCYIIMLMILGCIVLLVIIMGRA